MNFEYCNQLPIYSNRLPITKLQKFKLKSHDPSMYNCVIDYQEAILNYQWEKFKNASKGRISSKYFLKSHHWPINMWLVLQKIFKVFQNLIVLFSYKQIIGQTLANQLNVLLRSSTCIIFSKRKKNLCAFWKKKLLWSRDCLSLELSESWIQEREISRLFRSCKWVLQR